MKKLYLLGMMILVLSMFAVSASAVEEITVTGEDEVRMYEEGQTDDNKLDRRRLEDEMDITSTQVTYTIENTGTEDLYNVTISVADLASKYDAYISYGGDTNESFIVASSLAVGESKQVSFTIDATIPALDDQDEYPEAASGPGITVNMGSLRIQAKNNQSQVVASKANTVFFENEPFLELYRVIISVDGEEVENLDRDEQGDTVEEIRPGSEIKVEVFIENRIDDRVSDDEIEDIRVYILAEDMDDGYDYEDDDEISRVRGEERESVTFTFTVPEDIKSDDYGVLLYDMEGDDELGNTHTIEDFDFEIEVERERNNLEIKRASITPENIRCNQRTARVFVEIQNVGEDEQDRAAIKLENSQLGISRWDRDIEELVSIEEDEYDSEYSNTYEISLPEDTQGGTYFLGVNAYIDDNVLIASRDLRFTIEECAPEEPTEPQQPEEDEIVPPPVDVVPDEQEEEPNQTEEDQEDEESEAPITGDVTGMRTSPLYTSLLVLANIGLVVVIVGLGIRLFRKD